MADSPLSSARVIAVPRTRFVSVAIHTDMSYQIDGDGKADGKKAHRTAAKTDHLLEVLYFY